MDVAAIGFACRHQGPRVRLKEAHLPEEDLMDSRLLQRKPAKNQPLTWKFMKLQDWEAGAGTQGLGTSRLRI